MPPYHGINMWFRNSEKKKQKTKTTNSIPYSSLRGIREVCFCSGLMLCINHKMITLITEHFIYRRNAKCTIRSQHPQCTGFLKIWWPSLALNHLPYTKRTTLKASSPPPEFSEVCTKERCISFITPHPSLLPHPGPAEFISNIHWAPHMCRALWGKSGWKRSSQDPQGIYSLCWCFARRTEWTSSFSPHGQPCGWEIMHPFHTQAGFCS